MSAKETPITFITDRAGAWGPNEETPTWGISLHDVGDGEYAAGFWFGEDSIGTPLWIMLAPGGAAQLLRKGVVVDQGTWQAERRGDELEFFMEVPRQWTHPVDISPSPNETVFEVTLVKVI